MKKIIFLPFCLLFYNTIFCQLFTNPFVTDVAKMETHLALENSTFLFIDAARHSTLPEILQQRFTPLEQFAFKDKIPNRLVPYPLYLSFNLKNSGSKNISFYYFPGMLFDKTMLYQIKGNNQLAPIKTNNNNRSGYIFLTLAPGEQQNYLLQLKFTKTGGNSIESAIIEPSFINNFSSETNPLLIQKRTAGFILSGVLLMMILFTLVNYFINGKVEFLYNCIYSVCMFLLIMLTHYTSKSPGNFKAFFISYFDLFLLVIGTISYLVFTRKFLETERLHPKLNKFLQAEAWVLFVLMIAYSILHFFFNQYLIQVKLEDVMKIIMLVAGLVYIFLAFIEKNRLMSYLAFGSSAQLFFSIISFILILKHADSSHLFTSPIFYFEIGVIFSVLFFILGLTYKNRLELIEKVQEQEALKLEAEKQNFGTQLAIIKAQQEERNRISADMHDDLGAGMTSIRLYSELAKVKIGDMALPEIEKISTSADDLINKMNAIIWSMSSHNDTLGNMVAYIRSYAVDYFEDKNILVRINLPERIPELQVPGTYRRNIFLVIKEALHNIVKHAEASEVFITLLKQPDGFTLTIQDNGKGIDFNNLRAFSNGLKNMKKRMEDIEVEFKIENNNGTLITLYRKTR
ncbi:MAG: 7TM diverse intracellular signaling domain-containing protein [Ferruginibacter sp.]